MNRVNLMRNRFADSNSRDLVRANQDVLIVLSKFSDVSLGPWSSGIDNYNFNQLLFAFSKSGLNSTESSDFLKLLKEVWQESGFKITHEEETIGYRYDSVIDYSYVIGLEIAS